MISQSVFNMNTCHNICYSLCYSIESQCYIWFYCKFVCHSGNYHPNNEILLFSFMSPPLGVELYIRYSEQCFQLTSVYYQTPLYCICTERLQGFYSELVSGPEK